MSTKQTSEKPALAETRNLRFHRAALVYQAGIANVFAVDAMSVSPHFGRNARRLLQSDFRSCAMYARGLMDAGVRVHTMACNQAGDVTNAEWTMDLESQPFSDHHIVVTSDDYFAMKEAAK